MRKIAPRLSILISSVLVSFALNLASSAPAIAANSPQIPAGPFGPKILDFNSDKMNADQKEWLQATLLTQVQAKGWFKFLSAQGDIPFRYPDDGCYARAHRMAQLLDQAGVRSLKVFVYATPGNPFTIKTRYSPQGFVQWSYHVAPAVLVGNKEHHSFVVLDPSLESEAVEVSKWINDVTSTAVHSGAYAPQFAYAPNKQYFYYWLQWDLENAISTNRIFLQAQIRRGFGPTSTNFSAQVLFNFNSPLLEIEDTPQETWTDGNGTSVTFVHHQAVYRLEKNDPSFARLFNQIRTSIAEHTALEMTVDSDMKIIKDARPAGF